MKIKFEFDTDSENWQDDQYKLNRFNQSLDMALTLHDLNEQVFSWWDNDERDNIPSDEIRRKFIEILEKRKICLDELLY